MESTFYEYLNEIIELKYFEIISYLKQLKPKKKIFEINKEI